MNIFNKIISDEQDEDRRLGCPSRDKAHFDRRMAVMAQMTGGRGFRTPPKGAKLSKGGKTRKELVAAGLRKPRLIKVRP